VVDDVDAEMIMDCVQNAIVAAKERQIELSIKVPGSLEGGWYIDHIRYLEDLKKKMKNTRVEK
jgi:hypothetical protein